MLAQQLAHREIGHTIIELRDLVPDLLHSIRPPFTTTMNLRSLRLEVGCPRRASLLQARATCDSSTNITTEQGCVHAEL
jgi:hypothetical protein